jgi:hypothetical protein
MKPNSAACGKEIAPDDYRAVMGEAGHGKFK